MSRGGKKERKMEKEENIVLTTFMQYLQNNMRTRKYL